MSDVSCDSVHPWVKAVFESEIELEEDALLDQIANCATTEYVNWIQDLSPTEVKEEVVLTWGALWAMANAIAELSLYTYRQMSGEKHVKH